jgi:uncharacterized repeat protein (TIGR01451 family)
VSGNVDYDPWLASGTDVNTPTIGFDPFIYATTTGTLTTLRGTAGDDSGGVGGGDPVTMTMNGQSAYTSLAELLSFDIQLLAGGDAFILGQTGIPTTFDAGPDVDTLFGTNVAQTWNITGPGSGNIPGAANSFSGVEDLRAGTAVDSFVFGPAGSIAVVDGDLGVDSLDNSAMPGATITPTGPGTMDGLFGDATGITGFFDNINIVAGQPANLTVTKTGPATATPGAPIAYTITVTNAGPNDAVDVELTDTLPAGTTFVSLAAPAGWSCSTPAVGAAGTVTCTRLTMPVSTDPFTLTVNAPATPATVVNTATVTSANEGGAGDESDSATTAVAPAVAAVAVPALDVWALLVLMAMLAAIAMAKS